MPSSVLVLGSGGREYAIAWALYRNEHAIYVSPGNGGSKFTQIDLNLDDERDICSWCEANGVIHVIVGPEALLDKDIVNRIHNINPAIRVFGPTKGAAQLEISKIYAKEFMKQNDIATADYYVINKDTEESAIEDIIRKKCNNWENGIVVKMDGLASGKGVTLTNSTEDAIGEVKRMQKAGNGQVLVEERLNGIELSALAFCDGKVAIRMPLVKDHKRLLEGDKGPNTGGMGVVGPIFVSNQIDRQIDEIFEKTLNGMRDRKTPYKGVLYAGLMIVDGTVYVLEFNCRFGDPETQVLMPLLDDDLLRIVNSCWDGNLSHTQVRWFDSVYACAVVVAANNYPYSSDKGTPITISQNNDNAIIFHAGTKKNGDKLETNGGRIFCVTGMAPNIADARKNALRKIESIEFEGKQFRKDIGMADLNEITGAANCASYSSSGVSIEQGNEFVDKIKRHIQSTLIEGTEQIGGFGAQIDLNRLGLGLTGELVVGMDGVGTKIEVASTVGDYSQVGNDLVAMCANDVLCHAARPTAFLDYFVCGKLELKMAEQVVASICEACNAIKCAVVGGETAEMPQVYGEKQWDLAGCMIAVRQLDWPKLPSDTICEGDKVIGLPSSGVHSNGFSLIRQILAANQIDYSIPVPWENDQNDTIGKELLKGTRLYVNQVFPLLMQGLVKGCAHITGGGLKENIIRVLSNDELAVQIELGTWPVPPIFQFLSQVGPVDVDEMLKVFNCGIGFTLVVDQNDYQVVKEYLNKIHEPHHVIGEIIKRKHGDSNIRFVNYSKRIFKPQFSIGNHLKCQRKIRVAILISGTGSNMVKLIEYSKRRSSHYEVVLVISNKPNAGGIAKAKQMGIPVKIVENTKVREEGEKTMAEILREFGAELICLAGFMRILTPFFVSQWRNRILNIHPSLLPSFKGARAVEDALEFGAKIAGCTVHLVDEEVDHGKILAQEAVQIGENDTAETLHATIQAEEYKLFPIATDSYAAKLLKEIQTEK